MKLLGVDVGFSKVRKTTGIACLDDARVYLTRAEASWESRKACLPAGFCPSVIALDGPLVPYNASERIRRRCEWVFVHSPFHNRCKPGLSDWGRGLELRRAAADACTQFSSIIAHSGVVDQKAVVRRDGRIVEAFPNAFLAVLLTEQQILGMPRLCRGERFDWLYEKTLSAGSLQRAILGFTDLPDEIGQHLVHESDHERRAALICLLTAIFVAAGASTLVGDAAGGWFCLPPLNLWQEWAKSGLQRAAGLMATKGQPLEDCPIG